MADMGALLQQLFDAQSSAQLDSAGNYTSLLNPLSGQRETAYGTFSVGPQRQAAFRGDAENGYGYYGEDGTQLTHSGGGDGSPSFDNPEYNTRSLMLPQSLAERLQSDSSFMPELSRGQVGPIQQSRSGGFSEFFKSGEFLPYAGAAIIGANAFPSLWSTAASELGGAASAGTGSMWGGVEAADAAGNALGSGLFDTATGAQFSMGEIPGLTNSLGEEAASAFSKLPMYNVPGGLTSDSPELNIDPSQKAPNAPIQQNAPYTLNPDYKAGAGYDLGNLAYGAAQGAFNAMNPMQMMQQWASGAGQLPWNSPGGLLNMGSGIYGLLESRKLKKQAQESAARADPWGTSGGRGLADTQLQTLMKDPSGITKMPGYEAGIEAVQRSMAAQGYNGSGNMMAALQKYGGDFYNNAIAQLSGLAGTGINPGNAEQLRLNGQIAGNDLASRSLATLGYGVTRMNPNQIPWMRP